MLTREQLNELIDMNEVKKIIKAKTIRNKRRSLQPDKKKSMTQRKEEILKVVNSGLVLQTNVHPKKFL